MNIPFSMFEQFAFASDRDRFEVARRVTIQEERDSALKILALDLIHKGEFQMVIEIAVRICDDSMRDCVRRTFVQVLSEAPLPRLENLVNPAPIWSGQLPPECLEEYVAKPEVMKDQKRLSQLARVIIDTADPIRVE